MVYEKYLKHKVARELDVIQSERNTYNRLIATDAAQGSRTRLLPNQYKRISYELTSAGAQVIKDFLQIYLKQTQNSLDALLKEFLTIDDDNFDERYNIFYEHIAPHIELYSFNIGDTMTLRSLTKAGYFKAIKVKLYGIFKFKGLEDSDLAGAFCLTDLVSFRELYGVMSQSLKNELSDLKALLQDVDVDDENLEDALFGGDTTLEQSATGFSDATEPLKIERENLPPTYEKTDIDQGLSPHIAIILKDNVDPSESEIALKEFIATSKLELQTSTWQESTGLIGSFVIVLRIVLYVAIFIIFLVALVIINNSMVMNTFERVPEIGTMRAIGAQRIHILALFLLETCILGIFSGVAGMLLGIGSIEILGEVGIQAPTREMTFMFSGPRLYPQLEYSSLIVGFVIVVGASIISTVYPATVAARIEPVIAMQPKE